MTLREALLQTRVPVYVTWTDAKQAMNAEAQEHGAAAIVEVRGFVVVHGETIEQCQREALGLRIIESEVSQ